MRLPPASICKAAPVMKLIVSDIVPGVKGTCSATIVCLTRRIIGHHLDPGCIWRILHHWTWVDSVLENSWKTVPIAPMTSFPFDKKIECPTAFLASASVQLPHLHQVASPFFFIAMLYGGSTAAEGLPRCFFEKTKWPSSSMTGSWFTSDIRYPLDSSWKWPVFKWEN